MSVRIVLSDPDHPQFGEYLADYDHDYRPDDRAEYPCGAAHWTSDPAEALTFDSPADAFEVWNGQSSRVPFRPDGEPNRPLTAYTIEVRPLEGGRT